MGRRGIYQGAIFAVISVLLASCGPAVDKFPLGFDRGLFDGTKHLYAYVPPSDLNVGGIFRPAVRAFGIGPSELCPIDRRDAAPNATLENLGDKQFVGSPLELAEIANVNIAGATLPVTNYVSAIKYELVGISKLGLDEQELERLWRQRRSNCANAIKKLQSDGHYLFVLAGVIFVKSIAITVQYKMSSIKQTGIDIRQTTVNGIPVKSVSADGLTVHRAENMIVEIVPRELTSR